MNEALQEFFAHGFVALAVGTFLIGLIYTYGIRPRLAHFKAKGLRVTLNTVEGLVHIEADQSVKAHQVKLGCGIYDFQRHTKTMTREKWHRPRSATVYMPQGSSIGTVIPGSNGWTETITQVVPTGFTTMNLYQLDPIPYYHQQWRTLTGPTQEAKVWVATVSLTNDVATALQRWINAHRGQLIPNERQIRQKWEQTCKRLRRECQQHTAVRNLSRALELVEFSADPEIRYLALGKDGKGVLKPLRDGNFIPVDFGQLRLTDTTLQHDQDNFRLTPSHVGKLHDIRRRWQKHHKTVA